MSTSLSAGLATPSGNGHIFFKVTKSEAYFNEARNAEGRRVGRGQFSLQLDVMALQDTVYIPLSLASGKKPTGFVYQIEGTGEGLISSADVSCKGEGVAQVTLGTLRYVKIPTGKMASFKMVVHIEGKLNKQYAIAINRINYKLNPGDARYKKLDVAIGSKVLKFE